MKLYYHILVIYLGIQDVKTKDEC